MLRGEGVLKLFIRIKWMRSADDKNTEQEASTMRTEKIAMCLMMAVFVFGAGC